MRSRTPASRTERTEQTGRTEQAARIAQDTQDTRTAPQPAPHRSGVVARLTACLAALAAAGILAVAPAGAATAATAAATPETPAANGSALDFSTGNSVLKTRDTAQVAPGLDVTSFSTFNGDANRWVTGNVLVADTTEPTLSMDLVDTGSVAGVAPVSQQIANDPKVVAAVNSDFFDMNASNAPVNTNASAASGIRSISPGAQNAVTVDANGKAAIQQLTGASTVTFGADGAQGKPQPIASVNSPSLEADGLAYYTRAWGTWPLKNVFTAANAANVHAAWIKDGKVERVGAIDDLAADTALADGEAILVGTGTQGDAVAALTPAEPVQVTVGLDKNVKVAAGGGAELMNAGAITVQQDNDYKHARMAAGISKDGTRLYLLEVDGNQADSAGMTLYEMARQLQAFGAWNAVNLDGGGSATMIARKAGTTAPRIVNRPSDGNERSVANALVFRSSASATTLADAQVKPAAAKAGTRVFAGLTRTFAGSGVASNGARLASDGTFAARGDVALEQPSAAAGSTAVVRGARHGAGTVTFTTQGATASSDVTVLGRLDHAVASDSTVSLQQKTDTASTTITGYDADGYDALVEPRDITVSGGDGVVKAEPQSDGTFLLTPLVDSGAATLTYTIAKAGADGADVTVQQAVTVGLKSVPVLDFADAAQWKADQARATGSLEPADGHATGLKGLRLQYDFTQSTATRGYYAVLPADKVLDGQPQMLTLWIKGDGSGAWPRIQVVTGDGVTTNLNGPNIDWTGWKQVSFPVPAGTAYPLTLQRIRIMEIRSTASYHGDITLSDLEEVVAPDAQEPANTPVHDPVIATGTSDVASRPLKVAVMSDAQFVARDPDGANVAHARETIRQIAAAKPDLMVIDGDFVDEGSEADLAFAKQILDEEVPKDLPYLYVPGNHEQMGDRSIATFEKVIGTASSHTDVKAKGSGKVTKVITLDSSSGTLHGQGVDQLKMLEEQLAAAKKDAAVTGVLVFTHMPIDDYLPSKNSQLGDRTEAARFAKELSDFRADSGKSIAIVNGHVGGFNATAFNGVSQITNGNSGKGPASTPDNGGFIGWTMLGVNPSSGEVGSVATASPLARLGWMRAETRPQIDAGSLTVLGSDGKPVAEGISLQEGSSVDLSATFTQENGTRTVPVQWPVSYVWSGKGVTVDDGIGKAVDQANGSTAVVVDARTGRLTAVKAGDVTVKLTVNGETKTITLHVGAKPQPSQPGQPGGSEPGQGGQGGGVGAGKGGAGKGGASASGRKPTKNGLASTGADTAAIAWAALLLAGAGAGVTLVLRRRGAR
ncbi:phosphodiester glycosidase family protein [Bifidobacterium saguinibicoloris]|uniref:phosphodiester glycosidase family protein n=1 Tax=Bifidobacterium saguinibicoloris TaxID=2834433 RepID=UPI001C5A4B51|nr:phosphodiester glycosidase family protein [Bifidobacterium saguinibicoloris]MBW3081578.1 phosphodiester glycosidase family protein [Bifidobacterium saguinibicoloris]